jgi:hypothetical protein
MSLWVELSVLVILAYFNLPLGVVFGVCWIIAKLFGTNREEKLLEVLRKIINLLGEEKKGTE